jgi:hypothetical protein
VRLQQIAVLQQQLRPVALLGKRPLILRLRFVERPLIARQLVAGGELALVHSFSMALMPARMLADREPSVS